MSYIDIYEKRINRFGFNPQERIQGKREQEFEGLLTSSPYRIDFLLNSVSIPGLLTKYKQDESQTLQYLLTRRDIAIDGGTILSIPEGDDNAQTWMVLYLENIQSSGYNRHILLKMTVNFSWTDIEGVTQTTYAFLFGRKSSALKNDILSDKASVLYMEDNNLIFLIMPLNSHLNKEDYLIIGTGEYQEQFRVSGYDRYSTAGVEYVSIDPTYARDLTPAPTMTEGDSAADFFWFNQPAEEEEEEEK